MSLLLKMFSRLRIDVFRKPSASELPALELDIVFASDILVFVSSKFTTFLRSVSHPSTYDTVAISFFALSYSILANVLYF